MLKSSGGNFFIMKICCFAGHSNIYGDQEKLKFNLKNEIIKLIFFIVEVKELLTGYVPKL